MGHLKLGTLVPVEPREVWPSEASGFTPWLASEDNLELLGETLGLELELEATEKFVGPFKADIICRDLSSGTDATVLIENQLEATDHRHLGQLLTYAAGLQAKTVIWIARRFTDEHRAALDMLNAITAEGYNFFGLEIELWRIGTSEPAPKFNVVCKPNDWVKSKAGASAVDAAEITPTKALQREFWAALKAHLEASKSPVRPTKPLPQHWMNLSIGRSHFGLVAMQNSQKKWIGAALGLYGPLAKTHYQMLLADRAAIEAELGEPLDWEELPTKKESRIALRRAGSDPGLKVAWPEQHAWLREKLEKLDKVFRPRVKDLDAESGQPSFVAEDGEAA